MIIIIMMMMSHFFFHLIFVFFSSNFDVFLVWLRHWERHGQHLLYIIPIVTIAQFMFCQRRAMHLLFAVSFDVLHHFFVSWIWIAQIYVWLSISRKAGSWAHGWCADSTVGRQRWACNCWLLSEFDCDYPNRKCEPRSHNKLKHLFLRHCFFGFSYFILYRFKSFLCNVSNDWVQN